VRGFVVVFLLVVCGDSDMLACLSFCYIAVNGHESW